MLEIVQEIEKIHEKETSFPINLIINHFVLYHAQFNTHSVVIKSLLKMLRTKCIVFVLFCALSVRAESPDIEDNNKRCSSLSCVHASASIVDLIDFEIDPCNDFFGYACGNFVEEVYTPDEKTTLDTLSLMNDKLTEYLLTLFSKPILETEPKIHKLSKHMFQSCEKLGKRFKRTDI